MSPGLRGASYAPDCGKIDPLKLCFAYARGARRHGARVLVDAPVQAVVLEGERVIGVRTPKGTFYGDMVVNAAGSWAGQVAALAGLDAPVKPRRGQVVVSEAVGPLVRGVISSAAYFALKFYPALQERFSEITRRLGHGFAVEQTQEGTLMLSYTNEFVGFDRRTTLEGLERILSVGCRFLPALREIHFIRGFSGLRPHTPDALPLVGPTALRPGFCFAAGHEGGGLALNPITGVLVAQIFCGESPIVDPAPIAPDRLVRLSTEREK